MLPALVTLQAALCAAQCSFWHALLQYSTLLHALHLLWPPLGQPGHAQRRRSPAPDAPALEPEEAALVVAPLLAERGGLRRDRHGRSVGTELFHDALGLVALGALGDQRRDGGGERSSRT